MSKRGWKTSKFNYKRSRGRDTDWKCPDSVPRYALRAMARHERPRKNDMYVSWELNEDDEAIYFVCRFCFERECKCGRERIVPIYGLSRMKKTLSRPRIRLKNVPFYNGTWDFNVSTL